jgi:hypothetical protein
MDSRRHPRCPAGARGSVGAHCAVWRALRHDEARVGDESEMGTRDLKSEPWKVRNGHRAWRLHLCIYRFVSTGVAIEFEIWNLNDQLKAIIA